MAHAEPRRTRRTGHNCTEPLAEQQRIVAKVAELMKWCDELEARLATAQSAAAALLDSSLHALLAADAAKPS